MTQALDSINLGVKVEDVTLPTDSVLNDMLLEIRFDASFFEHHEVELAVDQFMAAAKQGRLNHFDRVEMLRKLQQLIAINERTPAFSG